MKIDSGSFVDQLRMLKGVQGFEKPSEGHDFDGAVGGVKKQSFSDLLMHQYEETNKLGLDAENAMQRSILGQSENPHEAVIAVQKASLSLSMMMGIKERLERAFQEIIRTPI